MNGSSQQTQYQSSFVAYNIVTLGIVFMLGMLHHANFMNTFRTKYGKRKQKKMASNLLRYCGDFFFSSKFPINISV